MITLPNASCAVIPIEKFTEYALHPMRSHGKWIAFRDALGYNLANAHKLVENIRQNIDKFPAYEKGDKGFGMTFSVLMELTGENGRTGNVLTAWIQDTETGATRLTSAYVKKRRGDNR